MAKRVVEKRTSSEDKIKNLSLYFLQGLEVRLEGVPAELLEALDTAKVALHGDGKLLGHAPLRAQGGALGFTVPDLYPDDGPEVYAVCGVAFPAVSFTFDEHVAWTEFAEERELSQNLARQSELALRITQSFPTDEEINSVSQQLPELRRAHTELIKRQANAYADLDMSEEEVERISARVRLTSARIKALQSQLEAWSQQRNPLEQASVADPLARELQGLKNAYNVAFLEFCHRLATQRGLTGDAWDTWRERATGDDYANATEVIAAGNGFWTRGQEPEPMNRQQRRQAVRNAQLN